MHPQSVRFSDKTPTFPDYWSWSHPFPNPNQYPKTKVFAKLADGRVTMAFADLSFLNLSKSFKCKIARRNMFNCISETASRLSDPQTSSKVYPEPTKEDAPPTKEDAPPPTYDEFMTSQRSSALWIDISVEMNLQALSLCQSENIRTGCPPPPPPHPNPVKKRMERIFLILNFDIKYCEAFSGNFPIFFLFLPPVHFMFVLFARLFF